MKKKNLLCGSAIMVLLMLVMITLPTTVADPPPMGPQYQPDLIHWNPPSVTKVLGSLHRVVIDLKNVGDGICYGGWYINFSWDGSQLMADHYYTDDLDPYEGDTVTKYFTAQKGWHTLGSTLDCDNDVGEEDENNNYDDVYRYYWWL